MNKKATISYGTMALLSLGISFVINFRILMSGRRMMMSEIFESSGAKYIPFAMFLFSFVLNFILYLACFKLFNIDAPNRKKNALVIVSSLGIVLVYGLLGLIFVYGLLGTWGVSGLTGAEGHFIRGFMPHTMGISLVVVISAYFIYFFKRRQQMALENEKLQTENVQTRYEVLKNQLDPHFLFNSLNALSTIIDTDPVRAKDYVDKLSEVFRHTLQNKEVITLREELEFTKSYCSLMEVRYGDSLSFVFDINEEYLNYDIIPLSMQVLVENAVKHNIIDRSHPLTVTIAAGRGCVIVSNPIQRRKQPAEGEGIGLANLAERHNLKWNRDILICEQADVFSVTIPIVKNESDNN